MSSYVILCVCLVLGVEMSVAVVPHGLTQKVVACIEFVARELLRLFKLHLARMVVSVPCIGMPSAPRIRIEKST